MADRPVAVILAAGQGTRMKSAVPKVLHPLCGRPIIDYVVDLATEVAGAQPIVVVSPKQPEVREHLAGRATVVDQAQQQGTGDAVRSVPAHARSDGPVLVLNGDHPLFRIGTIHGLLEQHRASGADCTLLSFQPDSPSGYGRILRSPQGNFERIVEQSDLTDDSDHGECNTGTYVFNGSGLWNALEDLTTDNAQGEYYIVDVLPMLSGTVVSIPVEDANEAMGINTRVHLAAAEAIVRQRILERVMLNGVTLEDPSTTYIDDGVVIGADSVVHPMSTIRGSTVLGSNARVGPMAQLRDVRAGDRLQVGASVLESCELGNDVSIGHFNRVRPGTVLADGVVLGTHAEVKNSRIGARSHINHVACVLDSDVGSGVNVGAGTITCNYDGEHKHRTIIGNRVFVGSNSTLVAPVRIEDDAYIGAGSTITQDVPAAALGIARGQQRNVEGWTARRRSAEVSKS